MPSFTRTLADTLEFWGGTYTLREDGVMALTKPETIGLGHYPIFDESYRERLNGLIFDRYMLREIGHETPMIFRQRMRARMNEIMPYYNRLYRVEWDKIDPMRTIDMRTITTGSDEAVSSSETSTDQQSHTESNATRSGQTESDSDTKSVAKSVQYTHPQTQMHGQGNYASASNVTDTETGVKGTANESATTADESDTSGTSATDMATRSSAEREGESHTSGYQGSPGELINSFLAAMINVDTMLLDNLDDLFMQVWGTNETYFSDGGYY